MLFRKSYCAAPLVYIWHSTQVKSDSLLFQIEVIHSFLTSATGLLVLFWVANAVANTVLTHTFSCADQKQKNTSLCGVSADVGYLSVANVQRLEHSSSYFLWINVSNWNPSCFPTRFYISGVRRQCGFSEEKKNKNVTLPTNQKEFLKANNSANAATHLATVLCSLAKGKCIQMQSK